MDKLEIAANAFNLGSVYLAQRNNIHTWWLGIVACTLFGVLFFEVKLYADVTLQIFFILTGFYGFWNWKFGDKSGGELPITRMKLKTFLLFVLLAGAVTLLYGYALQKWTDASFPFIDSIVLSLSVLAQLLMMARKIENWAIWIVVNIVAVPLYASKELYLTAFIYFLFLLNAIYALRTWNRLMKNPT